MSGAPWDKGFRIVDDDEQTGESWQPIDLGPVLEGDLSAPKPSVLQREDGRALAYLGAVNGSHGDSGIGKSWLTAFGVKEQIEAGRNVLEIDYEDSPQTLAARLLALGVEPALIPKKVTYIKPDEVATPAIVDELVALVVEQAIAYAVIDSVGEAFAVEGINEDKDSEVGPWMRQLPRQLAAAGACVHLVDHATKAADNPLHPSGSKRKRAAITGASYLVEVLSPLVRSDGEHASTGKLKLICAKDRHGNYARGAHVATFELTSHPDGSNTAKLWQPTSKDRTADLPLILCARAAVRVAKEYGGPVSREALVGLMMKYIKASTELKRGGIDHAAACGSLKESAGPRGARLYEYVSDLLDDLS